MPLDAGPTLRDIERIQRNLSFGVARGLTQTAKAAADAVTKAMPSTFDRPTPFTRQGVGILPATREQLVATVFVKDAQAAYLELEETGGTRLPQRGSPINLPVDLRPNVYGNIPKGKIRELLSRPDVFLARAGGRTKGLPPGIYQRLKAKGRKRAKANGAPSPKLRLLISFAKKGTYRPRFQFRDQVEAVVIRDAPAILAKSVGDALAGAR